MLKSREPLVSMRPEGIASVVTTRSSDLRIARSRVQLIHDGEAAQAAATDEPSATKSIDLKRAKQTTERVARSRVAGALWPALGRNV